MSAVTELVAGLVEHGIPSAIAVPAAETRYGGRVPLVPCPVWRVPFGPILRLTRPIPLPRPVIVHVHGLASLVPWSPFAGGARGPVVATLHGVLDCRLATGVHGLKRIWHDRVDLPLLRRLSGVHVTRPSEVDSARPYLAPGVEARVISWPLADAPPPTPPAGGVRAEPSSPYLLFVGRLHRIKGIERAIAALAHPSLAASGVRLLVAGMGGGAYRSALSRRASTLGVKARVEFLDLLGPDALRPLYSAASALLLSSRYENFGMVVLEAMREGCPVIAAHETPWGDLDREGAGFSVNFDDPGAVARAVLATLDPGMHSALGAAGRDWHRKAFVPARIIPRFADWYGRVVRRAAGGEAA